MKMERKRFFINEKTETPTKTNIKIPGVFGTVEYNGERLLSYNGETISVEQYKDIARKNCYQAYDLYNRGQKLKVAGTVCISVGTPLTAAGLAFLLFSRDYRVNVIGGALAIVGLPTLATGIPLYCIGKSKKTDSFETFNNKSQGYTASELQLNLNTDGIGLALVF